MPVLLQLNATANWGSTGKIAEAIGLEAMKHGWECHIAYGRYSNPSRLETIKVGGPLNPYGHYLQSFILDREGLGSVRATGELVRKIAEIKPDIVHLHNIHDHWINYRILFEFLTEQGIRTVWTFHDCWAFTGHCFHFVTVSCENWKTLCKLCPLSDVYPKSLMDNSKNNFVLKRTLFCSCKNLTLVTCSEWLSALVKDSFLADKRSEVIHNGVDTCRFVPMYVHRPEPGYNVLAVSGVWNKSKGIDDIFRLRALLPQEYNIIVAGLSGSQMRYVPEGVTAIPKITDVQELVRLYNLADVFVNVSHADTFPTVNLEALACGTPVITYDTGGAPEAVDENTGVVVPCGDIVSMAQAVMRMKETPLSSRSCRERAVDMFDSRKCFSKYIRLYEDIIGDPVFPSGEFQE